MQPGLLEAHPRNAWRRRPLQLSTGASAVAETRFSSLLLQPGSMDLEQLSELLEPCRLPWGPAVQKPFWSVDSFQLQQTPDLPPLWETQQFSF